MRSFRCVRSLALSVALLSGVSAHAAEHGAVTAIASLSDQTAAFVGFSSGVVLYCTRLGGCTELAGTPSSAVSALDTPREGSGIRAWVGYEDGSIYFCTLTGACTRQKQE